MMNASFSEGNYSVNISFTERDHPHYDRPRGDPTNFELFLYWMVLYYTPIVIAVAVVGNVISCLVLLLSNLRKFSSSHYLACVVLANTLGSLVSLGIWMKQFGINTYDRPFTCHAFTFVKDISTFLSLWMLVSFVIDRYVFICWPAEATRLCTVMRARIVIGGLIVTSMVIHLNTSLTVGVVHYPQKDLCRPLDLDGRSMMVFDTFNISVIHILAYCAIIILYILICRNIFCCSNGDLRLGDSGSHFSLFTVVYVMWFLIFSLPEEVINLHMMSVEVYNLQKSYSIAYRYAYEIVAHISDTGKACNLLLFILIHPLFFKYLKKGFSKVKDFVKKCFKKKKDKTGVEEQITLQDNNV